MDCFTQCDIMMMKLQQMIPMTLMHRLENHFHSLIWIMMVFLSADELKPIIGKLHPGENFYAKQQADYVISQADTNKDGQLSLNEMIENPYVFIVLYSRKMMMSLMTSSGSYLSMWGTRSDCMCFISG